MRCTVSKLLPIVVLSCLAGQLVMASGFFGLGKKNNKIAVDFDALNDYLGRKVGDSKPESNIEQLRKGLKKLSGGLKRAAEIFIELADANECNEKLLKTLDEAASYKVNDESRTRVWKVIRGHLGKAMKLCKSYIDEVVPKKFEAADEALKQFTKRVTVYTVDPSDGTGSSFVPSDDVQETPDDYELLYNNQFETEVYKYQDWPATINANKLGFFLLELAQLASDSTDYTKADRQTFEAAFDKYLSKPCQQFEATFGTLFEGFRSLGYFKGSMALEFIQERSGQLRLLAYTHKVCLAVQIVDRTDDRKHGFKYNKQDVFRALISK